MDDYLRPVETQLKVIFHHLIGGMPAIETAEQGGAVGFSIGIIVAMSHPEWAAAYRHWMMNTPGAPSREDAKRQLADVFIHLIPFEFMTEREEENQG